ncbi:MAG: M20/M25/M40 family metallo-hydrolase [Candidatus Hydrothermales bacterium]
MEKVLRELCEVFGPSGFEESVKAKIKELLKEKKFDIKEDRFGNLVVYNKGKKPTITFSAHIDEIGIVCIDADKRGFLKCSPIGGVYPHLYTGHRVIFRNGVIGIFNGKNWKKHDVGSFEEIIIDIGCESKEEALKTVPIGEPAVIYSNFVIQDNKIIARNLDNRAGVSLLLNLLVENEDFERDLYFVFNVQEELGLRGARVFSEYIETDFVFTVDVSTTGDTYTEPERSFRLGGGAGIRVMDSRTIFPLKLISYLENLAEKRGIRVQRDAGSYGVTDAFSIQTARGGLPTVTITIPIRYSHSPSSFILKSDLEEVYKLIKAIIEEPPLS